MLYNPRDEFERKVFPNLGTAKIIGGLPEYIGKIGIIIQRDEEAARIVFKEFWNRPDGISIDDLKDNTWCFTGEYEIIMPT